MNFSKEVTELSLAEQLGETFMPRLEADAYIDELEYAAEMDEMVREHQVGGFCIFAATPESTVRSIESLQKVARESHSIPLIFSCDSEWGLPMRLRNGGTEFPDAMALGRSNDPELTEAVARATASEMKALGMHWNFAPVADINSNPNNPVINVRSFGDDPEAVAMHVEAYVRGLESEHVASSIKHFPGHGDTEVDSHKDMPKLMFGRERFEKVELVPFKRGIAAGAKSVMLGHIGIPKLLRDLGASEGEVDHPATLSHSLCRMIRDDWKYDGILVTDGLEMHGLTKHFEPDESCLQAFSAGLDVLLIPVDPKSAYRHMLRAAEQGRLSEHRIAESAKRILGLKRWVHAKEDLDPTYVIENSDHLALARKAGRSALEVNGSTLGEPFSGVLVFADARAATVAKARYLTDRITSTLPTAVLTPETGVTDFRTDLGDRPLIVVIHKARGVIGGLSDTSSVPELLLEAAGELKGYPDLTVVCLGSPYLDPLFTDINVSCMIKTFSESTASIDAVLECLGGRL